jgi:predicted nucleic acid-binding protein
MTGQLPVLDLPTTALLDSSWLIGVAKGYLEAPPIAVASIISRLEVLGYRGISVGEEVIAREVLGQINLVPIDEEVIGTAVRLRQSYGGKTVDVLIAATALNLNLPLLTRDQDFYRYREEIQVIGI